VYNLQSKQQHLCDADAFDLNVRFQFIMPRRSWVENVDRELHCSSLNCSDLWRQKNNVSHWWLTDCLNALPTSGHGYYFQLSLSACLFVHTLKGKQLELLSQIWYRYRPWQMLAMLKKWGQKVKVIWSSSLCSCLWVFHGLSVFTLKVCTLKAINNKTGAYIYISHSNSQHALWG